MFGQLFINHLHILIQHENTIFGFVKTGLRKIYLGSPSYLLVSVIEYILPRRHNSDDLLLVGIKQAVFFTCFELCSTLPSGGQNSPEWMLAVAVSCQSSGNAQACEEHLTEDLSAVYEKLWVRRRSDSRRHSTRGRLQYKSIRVNKNTFSNKKSQVDKNLGGVRAVRTQTVESFWALSTLPGLELLWLHPSTHSGCHLVLN